MNDKPSSCELPAVEPGLAAPSVSSRVLRHDGAFHWPGVAVAGYKPEAAHWEGVARSVLVGAGGETTAFHLRYFEVSPGGFTTREHHAHEHAVVVLRGRGRVHFGEVPHELAFGDVVYVAPHEVHQFSNPAATEPFGFLCIVDAQRDRPVTVTG